MKSLRFVTVLLSCLALSTCEANAKGLKVTLVDSKGVKVTFPEAFKKSAEGEKIYKCQEVKPTLSKSGASISFKVVK